MGNLDFNASEHEPPSSGGGAVPFGKYQCRIINTEKRENKGGNGSNLNVTFEVIAGELKGRKIFETFNLWHHSAEAAKYAQGDFSGLCHAIGIMEARNHEDIRNHNCVVDFYEYKSKKDGSMKEGKRYSALAGGTAPVAAAPAAAAPAVASATPPWGAR